MLNSDDEENKKLNEILKHFLLNWWVNYYHFLDPVSGALSHDRVFALALFFDKTRIEVPMKESMSATSLT